MTFEEIKESTKKSSIMPNNMMSHEQWTWQAVRLLIVRFSYRDINKQGVKRELNKIERAFEVAKKQSNIDFETAKMRVMLSDKFTQAEKYGCKYCKELAKIFDGRLKPK